MAAKLLEAAAIGNAAQLAALIQGGVGIESKHPKLGVTALIRAASLGHADCVRLLMDRGADKEAKDKNGMTALICAASSGHADCVRLLLKKALISSWNDAGVDGGRPLAAALDGSSEVLA